MTTTATATPAAQEKVHVEVPGFTGYGEFHGSNKDCSADAELMARHPLDGSLLDAATLNLWWGEYWNTGHHTSGGATLAHIYWHLTGSAHKLDPNKARVARYIPTDSVSLETLHQAIKNALVQGQTVIVYLDRALALPDNEHGVHGHFVALGGIDSDQGYLVGNGDTFDALGGHGIIPCHWHGWNQLVAAQINGMIALEKVEGTTMGTIPQGWKDDGKTLIAPNGVPVIHGFRDFVLRYPGGWEHDNWPERAEAHRESVEPGNAAIGPGARQDFRWRSLGWTQSRGAYVIWVGHDIIALENQLDAANKHISLLEEQLKQAQDNRPAPDPKASEAFAALVGLAKALKVIET